MFKSKPVKKLGNPVEYIKSVGGLNNVNALATYLASLQLSFDPSISLLYTHEKTEFQQFLDKSFEETINAEDKTIKELSGDYDFIKDKKRQELYKRITDNGVRMQFLMDMDSWNMKNAELLRSVGAEVMHVKTQEGYHFGTWADSGMFTLFREAAKEEARKVISEPQREEDVTYYFLGTNEQHFVKYANELWEEQRKRAISFEDQKAKLNKNKESAEISSQLLGG